MRWVKTHPTDRSVCKPPINPVEWVLTHHSPQGLSLSIAAADAFARRRCGGLKPTLRATFVYIHLSARCVCKSVGWGLPHRAGTPGFNGGASPTLHSLQPIGAHIVEPPPQLSRTSRELFQSPTGGRGQNGAGFGMGSRIAGLFFYGKLSNQVQRLFKIHFIRCSPLQTFARAVVQCPHRFLNIFIRILRNVLMFRAIFP